MRRRDNAKLYRVDNPDIGDLYNTLWKMAAKRAEGDGVLHLPGCSELFGGYLPSAPRRGRPEPEKEAPASEPLTQEELERDRIDLFGPQSARPKTAQAPAPQATTARATPQATPAPSQSGAGAVTEDNSAVATFAKATKEQWATVKDLMAEKGVTGEAVETHIKTTFPDKDPLSLTEAALSKVIGWLAGQKTPPGKKPG